MCNAAYPGLKDQGVPFNQPGNRLAVLKSVRIDVIIVRLRRHNKRILIFTQRQQFFVHGTRLFNNHGQ